MTLVRINKYLSSIGVASRRKIDSLVNSQKILVNGQIAKLGQKIDPLKDEISINNQIIKPSKTEFYYYILNKPAYVLSTSSDDRGRTTVVDLVKSPVRIFPVGRLDYLSTGLILLTNDGDLSLKLTHPRYHLPKVYLVDVIGKVNLKAFQTPTVSTQIFHKIHPITTLKMTLTEGKKRQIRLMCAKNHLTVKALHRISIGPINLGNLKEGESRLLTPNEVSILKS